MSTTRTEETTEEGLRFLLGDGHTLARSVLHWLGICWAIATALALLSGNAWGQHRRHHRRDRHPVAQAVAQGQPGIAQPVQPVARPSDCTGADAIAARDARTTGADAFERNDWETCASAYTISLSIAGGACARPEARQNLAICLDASGRSAQALEQLELLQRLISEGSSELPPDTNSGALQTRTDTIRRRVQAQQVRPAVPSALVCAGVQRACNGHCVDIQTDRANCGGCGSACPAGNTCSAGSCQLMLSRIPPPSVRPVRRTMGWVLIGVGGALAVGAGVGYGLAAHNDATQTSQDMALAMQGCEQTTTGETCLRRPAGQRTPAELADEQRKAAIAMTIGTVVSAGVGTILVLISPNSAATPPRANAFFDPSTGVVGVAGTF